MFFCAAEAEESYSVVNSSKTYESVLVYAQLLQWNEKMELQSVGLVDSDQANFSGMGISVEKNMAFAKWGWSVGATYAQGKASGGGNGQVLYYQKGNQGWSAYGLFLKGYQKLSSRIYLGLEAPVLFKSISWSQGANSNLSIKSGRDINLGLLFAMNFRLNQDLDLTQSIGTLNLADGSTFWKIGLGIRL